MWLGMLVALLGAVCSGVAAVIQALAARAVPDTGRGVHPRLLLELVKQWRFVLAVGLDLGGFVGTVVALQWLPIFLVQTITSANLVVTALVAWRVLSTHLRWIERGAIVLVCVSLSMLGVSAGPQSREHGSSALHLGLLAAVGGLVLLGFFAGRLPPRRSAGALGMLAGCGFGLSSVASRVLPGFAPAQLAADPATYVLPLAGITAFLFYATALQRESVTAATAGTVVGQTIFPALVGLLLLGDRTRQGLGFEILAGTGFVLAVVAALILARFGDLTEDTRAAVPREPSTSNRA